MYVYAVSEENNTEQHFQIYVPAYSWLDQIARNTLYHLSPKAAKIPSVAYSTKI